MEESFFKLDKESPYRQEGRQPKDIEIYVQFLAEGLGDNIQRLPAVQHMLKVHPHIKLNLWVPDYFKEIVENLYDFEQRVEISRMQDLLKRGTSEEYRQKFMNAEISVVGQQKGLHTTFRSRIVDHAFARVLDMEPLNDQDRSLPYLDLAKVDVSEFHLPVNYAVITVGFTAMARHWPGEEINKVVEYLKSKKITPIFVGKEEVTVGDSRHFFSKYDKKVKYARGRNFINNTTLLQAAKIMKGARAVFGVDNGPIHLAALSGRETKIVAGYTSVDPRLRLPYREGKRGFNCETVLPETQCRYCQSRMNFVYDHDFKFCFYGDYKCTKEMTGEKFIEAFERIDSHN